MRINFLGASLLAVSLLACGSVKGQDDEEEVKTPREFDLVINAMPASVLIDMSGNKFKTFSDGTAQSGSMSQVFTMPNILAGIGTDLSDGWYVDATVGPGIIINDTFRSVFLQGVVSANYLVSDSFQLGPRAGIVHHLDPSWTEDDAIDFDSATGYLAGIYGALGDTVKYWVSVDVMSTEFDVEVKTGTANDTKFDLTGLAIQFGVRGEF